MSKWKSFNFAFLGLSSGHAVKVDREKKLVGYTLSHKIALIEVLSKGNSSSLSTLGVKIS